MAYTPSMGVPTFGLGDLGLAEKPRWPFVLNRQSDQSNGLVGWWPSDPGGNAKLLDLSGSGNHGARTGTPTIAPGKDGGLSYLYPSASNSFFQTSYLFPNTTGGAGLTISCWVRGNTDNKLIWSQNNGASLGLIYNTGFLSVQHSAGSTQNQGWAYTLDSNWHLITVVFPPGWVSVLTIFLYVDGVARPTGTINGVGGTATSNFTIGGRTAGSACWVGNIEDVRVYSRGMTPSEVWALWDPKTRWELRYQPGRRRWFLPQASGPPTTGKFQPAWVRQAAKVLGVGGV